MEYLWTRDDLIKCSREYDANFKLLMATVDTPEHDFYVQRERELNKKGEEIRRELGLWNNFHGRGETQRRDWREGQISDPHYSFKRGMMKEGFTIKTIRWLLTQEKQEGKRI